MKKNLSILKIVDYMCGPSIQKDIENQTYINKIYEIVHESVFELKDAYEQGVTDCKNGIVDGPPPNAEKYIVETYNPTFKDS